MPWYLPVRCPVFWEELRRRMRGGRGQLVLLAFGAVMALILLLAIVTHEPGADPRKWSAFGKSFWRMLLIGQLIAMFIIAPGLAANAISTEREKGTLELLFLSPISTLSLVAGKVLGAFGQLLVIILSGLPVVAMVFLYGGVSPLEVTTGYLLILLTGLLYASLGFLASCLFRHVTTAIAWAYGFTLILLIGLPALLLVYSLLNPASSLLLGGAFWAITANPFFIYLALVDSGSGVFAAAPSVWSQLGMMGLAALAALVAAAFAVRRLRGIAAFAVRRVSLEAARYHSGPPPPPVVFDATEGSPSR